MGGGGESEGGGADISVWVIRRVRADHHLFTFLHRNVGYSGDGN